MFGFSTQSEPDRMDLVIRFGDDKFHYVTNCAATLSWAAEYNEVTSSYVGSDGLIRMGTRKALQRTGMVRKSI